ncbi:hypothetical protein Nepgr_005709 [Nepenthes gracilis]|uniref:Uncharacterized protein n=1 Tax=Nepenthes gracilis TaxID=150966 RepID=A0AAD3XGP9_NEPGR|nr:hypothetical protein Nepgr_005709 [Nepenthes gracilis]
MNAGVLLVVWFDINYLAVRGQGKMDRYKAASSILKLCVIILSLSTVVGRPNGVDGGIHEAKKIPALLDRLRATAGNCRDAVNKLRIRVRNVSSLLILSMSPENHS